MAEVSAIVLAAGLSVRMQGPNKLLLAWKETTVVGAVVATLLKCDVETLVVTGRDSEEIAQAVAPARAVYNAEFEQGMGTSISTGVRASEEGSAVLMVLGDMPALNRNVVQQLIENCRAPSDIILPIYTAESDRYGHPVLFGADYRDALLALDGDTGARAIIESNNQHLKTIVCEGSLRDVDSVSDLKPRA